MKRNPITPVVMRSTAISLALASCAIAGDAPNGFPLTSLRVERDAIKSGGVPRDGIPSIDTPKFIPSDKADFMKDDDLVLSYTHNGITRAYPLRILVWHEIVNETINGKPILVTYCPLCGTAMIFDRKVGGKTRAFGVSGLLYQSDVLMYDREKESLWSQIKMEAVSGPLSGTKLEWLPSEHLTWKAWKAKYPKGEVLSTETGHVRSYNEQAYESYFKSPKSSYPVPKHNEALPEKEWVVGVINDGKAIAFPLAQLGKASEAKQDGVSLKFDPTSRLATAADSKGNELASVTVFWFAWQAFYPQTTIWKP